MPPRTSRVRGFSVDGLLVPAHPPSDCRPYFWLAPPVPDYFARYAVREAEQRGIVLDSSSLRFSE